MTNVATFPHLPARPMIPESDAEIIGKALDVALELLQSSLDDNDGWRVGLGIAATAATHYAHVLEVALKARQRAMGGDVA